MEDLTAALSTLLAFLLVLHAVLSSRRRSRMPPSPHSPSLSRPIPGAPKRVLLVTSHPDDETMFFGPTLVQLNRRPETQVRLLCLSTGNFQKRGLERKRELYDACKQLGIKEENVTLLK